MLRENGVLTPTARTLWEIQARTLRLPVESASNAYVDTLRRREAASAIGEARRNAVNTPQALMDYQQEVRSLFLQCIGGLPERPAESVHQITGKADCGAYIVEKILLQPRKDAWASANVYVPAHAEGKCPAVLVTVGHDDRGKADPEYQYLAQLLASAGIITLVLDPFGQGERFEHYETELDFQPIQGCSGEHDLMDWKAKLLGMSLARYFIQDGLCALDYLASRPDVDANRIGLTGHSGGGTQTTMLMMAAGDRFACAAPCAYVTDARAMMETGIDPDNEMLWPGYLSAGLDYVDFVAGVAPRPVLLLTNRHDFFPREGTLRTLDAARSLWKAVGSAATVDIATAESQHAYPHSLAQAAAQFFMTNLGAAEDSLPALLAPFTFTPKEPAELWCTPEGQLLKYAPGMRTIHDELKDELLCCRELRKSRSPAELKTNLTDLLRLDEINDTPEPRVFAEGICGHIQYRCMIWRPQDGYWNSGALLRDMRHGDKPLPTVIGLWPEGVARMCEHSGWIHRCMQKGYQVLVMDVAASGALLPHQLGNNDMYIGWSTMYNLNAYLMQLGDSFFALRTRQIAAAVRMLRGWPEADSTRITLYAEKEFSRYADLAALLTDTPVCSDSDFQPWEEIVTERYHDQTYSHAWILPGALRYFDTPEIKSLLKQQGLQVTNPGCFANT